MDILQKTQIIAQIIGTVALLVTLGIYYLQLRTMAEQVAAMQRGADAQQILSLLSFIESDEVRVARTVVYTTLHRKHFSEWTESELQAATKLCASFSTAGAVLRSGIVPVEPILESWGAVLRRCYQILEPFIQEMRKPENAGPQFGMGFVWLHSQLDGPQVIGSKAQNLGRGTRDPNVKAISKDRTAEANNVD